MKKKELIDKLKEVPGDYEVTVDFCEVIGVRSDDKKKEIILELEPPF